MPSPRTIAEIVPLLAGERNADDLDSYIHAIPHGNATRLDIGTTETLVTASPCIVLSIMGNDANTGYTDLIDAAAIASGNTPVYRVNCGDGVNPMYLGAIFANGLCVDGENVAHDVTVTWWPL